MTAPRITTRETLEPFSIGFVTWWADAESARRAIAGSPKRGNPLLAFNDSDDNGSPTKPFCSEIHAGAARTAVLASAIWLRVEDGTEIHPGLYGWHMDPRSWDEYWDRAWPIHHRPLPAGRKDFQRSHRDMYPAMFRCALVATQSSNGAQGTGRRRHAL